jgi:hypothetical protein
MQPESVTLGRLEPDRTGEPFHTMIARRTAPATDRFDIRLLDQSEAIFLDI